MTPHTLYTLLGLGLLAVAALVVIGVGACRIPRVATAAEEGRPGPSLVWLIVAGLILCAVWSPPGAPLSPGWEHDPIPCAQDCGWNYYYVIVIGALRLLTIAAVALVCAFAAGLLRSMQAWLDNPADTDGVTVTNGQRLARRWRILAPRARPDPRSSRPPSRREGRAYHPVPRRISHVGDHLILVAAGP